MLQDHIDYINFAELAKRCDLSENDIRLLILREKLVPSIWLDHFALNPSGPSGFYYLLSPRQNEAFNCAFFNASCVRFGRGNVYAPGQTRDVKFYDILPVSLDNVITSGVVMRVEVERLEQSRRETAPLESDSTTPNPAPEPKAAPYGTESVSNFPWWRVTYDVFDMAQNIGARLHGESKRASNAAIAKEIEMRINGIERSKGRDRSAPNHDTIRGVLTGWKWKPD